tara:strand:- start:335 stop:460 length:126 start_codon:yes stop_codon:yes gene_type:complete
MGQLELKDTRKSSAESDHYLQHEYPSGLVHGKGILRDPEST